MINNLDIRNAATVLCIKHTNYHYYLNHMMILLLVGEHRFFTMH